MPFQIEAIYFNGTDTPSYQYRVKANYIEGKNAVDIKWSPDGVHKIVAATFGNLGRISLMPGKKYDQIGLFLNSRGFPDKTKVSYWLQTHGNHNFLENALSTLSDDPFQSPLEVGFKSRLEGKGNFILGKHSPMSTAIAAYVQTKHTFMPYIVNITWNEPYRDISAKLHTDSSYQH